MSRNKNISEFIKENKLSFDINSPSIEHEKRFEDRLLMLSKQDEKSVFQIWKFIAIAASIGFIFMSMVSVYYYGQNQATNKMIVSNQIKMQENMILSLIENQSASKRLKAVNYIEECKEPTDVIISAIIKSMYHDDNSNVRLSAAESLSRFSYRNYVKKALAEALIFERDPSVQLELINILVKIKEKSAVEPMQNILKNKNTPEFIKEQIKDGISEISIDKL